jgi:hypothetical protein
MPTPLIYQFDKTAVSPANLVTAEVHNVNIGEARLIVLTHGLFFTENIVIRNAATTTELVKGTDYTFRGFDPEISALAGHECASAIYFPSFSGPVEVDYQVVGGYQSMNSAIMKEVAQALAQLPPADFEQLANAPTSYAPDPHMHSFVDDLTNLEKFRMTVEDLKQAIINKRSVLHSNQALAEKVQRLLYIIAGIRESIAGVTDLDLKEDKINKKDDLSNPVNINHTFYPTTQAVVDYLNSLPGGNAAIPYAADLVFDTSDQAQMIIREGQVSAPKLEMLPFITTGSWTGNDTALVEFATVEGSGGAIGNRGYDFVTDTSGTLSSAYTSKTVLNHDIFYPEIGLQGSVAGITEVYTSGDGPSTPGYWNGTNWIIRNLVDNSDFWKMVESPTGPGNGVTFQYNVATPYLAYGGGYMGWNGAPGSGWFDSIPGSIPVFPGNTLLLTLQLFRITVVPVPVTMV